MKSHTVNPSIAPYIGIVPYIHRAHLERVTVVAGAIGAVLAAIRNAVLRAWRELQSPPRPAWLIVAVRSRRRGNELSLRYALPPNP